MRFDSCLPQCLLIFVYSEMILVATTIEMWVYQCIQIFAQCIDFGHCNLERVRKHSLLLESQFSSPFTVIFLIALL